MSSTPGASILLVEDDPDTARVITELLESRGHRVRRAENGAAARALAEELMPDLVLLDLILPDVDGLVLCAELRERVDMPVIICSGTQRQRDAVLGMKICADDFVAKPFDLDELVVRVEGVLRRARGLPPGPDRSGEDHRPRARVGDLVLDADHRRALLGPRAVVLTPTEYRLLAVLVEHQGEVLPREQLGRLAWGYWDRGLGRAVDTHISHVRGKLERLAGDDAPAILCVRGVGYSIVPRETAEADARAAS